MDKAINGLIKSGKRARLMPPLVNSKTEERATSCLLASFMVVPKFAISALDAAGAPSGKRLKVDCYTEVVFKSSNKDEEIESRPDGLIIATNGPTTWTALVEAKVGSNDLEQKQVERYLALAKANGINAVITISNQFVPDPKHHPLKIPKNKLRSVNLFHFSWHALLAKAVIASNDNAISDPEQSFILDDLINFLDHPSSGVSSYTGMHKDWSNVCRLVSQHTPLAKNSKEALNVVSSWQQLLRAAAIKQSREVGLPVEIALTAAQKKLPEQLSVDILTLLITNNRLDNEFIIPNAASKIRLMADLSSRCIYLSMKVDAPKHVTRNSAAINWLTRQLKKVDTNGVSVRVHWPKRITMTYADLSSALESPGILIPEGIKDLPRSLEVVMVVDLGTRFKSCKVIVEESNKHFLQFYKQVGQHINKWTAKAPKVKPIQVKRPDIEENESINLDQPPQLEVFTQSQSKEASD